VAAGVRVPCALPGATLPGGLSIKPVKMRGIESQGMLCSARELGLSDDHAGLLLLPRDAPVGAAVRDYLDLDETVWLLKLTPNLAHCMSVYGVARELAAIAERPLKKLQFAQVPARIPDRLPVTVAAPDLCGRFCGRIIRGVNGRAPTPDWIKRRLERAGQRSISALVDISNYVMLELGRPSHVFDLAKIHGALTVRWARAGESLKLLNGQTIELAADVGVIADDTQVESLAGIMGGDATAVSDDTSDIYLEAAFWWPAAIAGRARRYNFATDAGARFERGVDAATTVDHLEYLTALILDICGGQAGPVDDIVHALPQRPPVRMRVARARKVIGLALSDADIMGALDRLGLNPVLEGEQVMVVPPSHRFDLQIEEDLIEEVVRIWGFARLPMRPPLAPAPLRPVAEAQRPVLALKQAFAARDYQEVIQYSFVEDALDQALSGQTAIRLLNPIAAQMNVMRTTLWGGLIETLKANLNRKAARVRLFEVGRVFRAEAQAAAGPLSVKGVEQPWRFAALAYGPVADEQWAQPARRCDFFDLKGDVESLVGPVGLRFEAVQHVALHPGRGARVVLGDQVIGWIGELHPALQQRFDLPQAPLLVELSLDPLLRRTVPVYEDVSRFPPVLRDIAVVVAADVPAARVHQSILDSLAQVPAAAIIRQVRLFDEYRGKGLENKEKSLAFRLWMQDTDRTLSDADAQQAVQAVLGWLGSSVGARLRAGA
jgi:phenylalanyl-tRNA synthetase beta chain